MEEPEEPPVRSGLSPHAPALDLLGRIDRAREYGRVRAATPADRVDPDKVSELFAEYQAIWDRQSSRWGEFRRISDR